MNNDNNHHTLIIDIGKTHVKIHVLNKRFEPEFARQMTNKVNTDGDYPSLDTDAIWQWLCETIRAASAQYPIEKMTITTHGATAALVNRENSGDSGLVLPILDYEYDSIYEQTPDYENLRPDFDTTYSPMLPAGLNLGRQLYWLQRQFPQPFSTATDILMYPQYWVWRLTGHLSSEITSLGCHTDLWSLQDDDFSSLVDTLQIRDLFPPLHHAWFNCGQVTPELTEHLGVQPGCQVFNGLHDSNASFLRYRMTQKDAPFTVVSTGTWTILMASNVPLNSLRHDKDMLANIDALGTPVACARFMGGREFERICEQAGSWLGEQFTEADIQQVITEQVFALPDFSQGSGPFGGHPSGFSGPLEKISGIALATLYSALMIDYQLTMLQARGNVYIEGAFLKNPLLCSLLNQLRREQNVYLSSDSTGTVLGAAYLTDWQNAEGQIDIQDAGHTKVAGLNEYKRQWLQQIELGHQPLRA
ncbi:hypothetical protein FE810_07410 [Thalassotalea litorea]|uniref:Uncharacterized protein n=1 Tax=Thalassotalea litorea TaxID=2020715 RepID=A0A5R9IMC7_9GAMM|nr:FGGY family carbohydrate kinase [Thalassotalea litorea]TLU65739.1 hypothetical protein FE810_07410 [Thalassotalea litorea]